MASLRLAKTIVTVQTATIVGLLYWLYLEHRDNQFFNTWISQNFLFAIAILDGRILLGIIVAVATVTGIWVLGVDTLKRQIARFTRPFIAHPIMQGHSVTPSTQPTSILSTPPPFYETINLPNFFLLVALATQAVAMWFVTAAIVRISAFPPDPFYYLFSLPLTYWWGLAATLALLTSHGFASGRWRTSIEIASLLLLALYLQGLPSFVYQAPWFLDTFQHEGNTLTLINYGGWLGQPVWYVRQFPGAYSFLASLTMIAGIDPYNLMKYYIVGLSSVITFFVYVIARMYNPNLAGMATALILGGLWFQLHLSPQSIGLIFYLGILFALLKAIRGQRWRTWAIVAVTAFIVLVPTHPETPIDISAGVAAFLVLSFFRSKKMVRQLVPQIDRFLTVATVWIVFWYSTIATGASLQIYQIVFQKAFQGLQHATVTTSNIPATPTLGYSITTLLDEGVSVSIWLTGLFLLLFFKRLRSTERLMAGLALAAILTIPLATVAKVDVLQRSYLFALFPVVFLFAWTLGRKSILVLRKRSVYAPLKVGFVLLMIAFTVLIPVTRYGVDSFVYQPQSSLFASDVASGLGLNSILFLHPGEYGWRFYAALHGDTKGPQLEQSNIAFRAGGFTKPTSDPSSPAFNLTFTSADASSDYVVLSDFYQNLYILKFGSHSSYYLTQKNLFEGNVSQTFNLVYSTGTDRIYANRDLG